MSLAAGTTLTVNAGIKLSNQTASTLALANATTSLVDLLGSGVQDTVAALVINGVSEPAGTYGAAGSGATFPLPDFEGTGELVVLPEPSTWLGGLGLLAAAGLALRRRHARAT